jgi:hypothetical protein
MDTDQTLEEITRDGVRAGAKWARPGASPEALAEAGLPPTFFEDMERESRVGIGHKMGLVHSGQDWCDDPTCRWCTPARPCPPGETYVCKFGRTHTWHRSCPGCVVV